MPDTDCPPRPQPAAAKATDALVCVIGTADAMTRFDDALQALRSGDVSLMSWRLDDDFGEPPPAADWADGLVVLNSDVWAARSVSLRRRSCSSGGRAELRRTGRARAPARAARSRIVTSATKAATAIAVAAPTCEG